MDNLPDKTQPKTDNQAKEEKPLTSRVNSMVTDELKKRYTESKETVFSDSEINKIANNIMIRETKSQLEQDMLAILSAEQKNALAKYALDCEKEKLDYQKKKEKNLVKQQVKAEVFNKKVDVLKNKYGYLYKKDENGNLLNFIPSKSYNKYKAFCNWWDGTTDGFKKIVKGTLKVMFWVALVGVIGLVGYKLIMWISTLNIPH